MLFKTCFSSYRLKMVRFDKWILTKKQCVLTLLLTILTGGSAFKGVTVVVPQAASIGDTVTLQCRYDLEGEPLYTVKWYKGRNEIYRFIPKELPSTRVFPFQEIAVDLAKSNQNAIVIRNLQPEHTGKYSCEVSTDAPNFTTHKESGYMYVISMPDGKPEVFIEKDSYEIGYTLRGNCSSPPSYPAVNLTWYINGKKVNESSLSHLPDTKTVIDSKRKAMITVAGLEVEIDANTFQAGKARIKCSADMFNIYHNHEEVILVEERPRPRPSSVLGTRDSASGNMTPRATFVIINCAVVILALITR